MYHYVVHIFLQLCEFFLLFVEDENAWTLNMHEGTLHINKFSNSLYAELANAFIDDSDDDDDVADDDDDDDDVGVDVQVNEDDDDDACWKVLRLLTRRCRGRSTQSSQPTAMKLFDRPPAGRRSRKERAWQGYRVQGLSKGDEIRYGMENAWPIASHSGFGQRGQQRYAF